MNNLKVKTGLNIILIISIISLISAYFIEYVLGHQPCNLCLIERVPYGLSIILVISNYIFKGKEKLIILLLVLSFLFSLLISIYHFGIEKGFIEESAICTIKNTTKIISKEQLLEQLQERIISCKDVTFRFFGFSLTTINIIISLILSILLIKLYKNYEKYK